MNNKEDGFNSENIRCSLGLMEHTMVNMIYTNKDHHGLKNKDPVIIIHEDDFLHIIEELPDSPLKLKLSEIVQTGRQR